MSHKKLFHCVVRKDQQIAVGAYNNSIFLVGGDTFSKQITVYEIDTDTFINIGENVLTNDAWGQSQFWSQREEILYMIQPVESYCLSTFNLKNQQYIANWKNFPVDVWGGCLATSNHYLYVVGGWGYPEWDYLNIVQVMEFSTYEWMDNAPLMHERRGYHACIAHSDHLWVFGGFNSNYLQSNERININDIAVNEWSYIDPLNAPAYMLNVAAWYQNIFIIGGYNNNIGAYINTVQIVDVTTGQVTLSQDTLVYPVSSAGTIITNNVIYVFGGSGGSYINTWMQYRLFQTTQNPSSYPSIHPSTIYPNIQPSVPFNQTPNEISTSNTLHNVNVSKNGSISSRIPSSHPSKQPSQVPYIYPEVSFNQTPIITAVPSAVLSTFPNVSKKANGFMTILWSVIGCIVICISAIVVILCCRKHKSTEETNEKAIAMSQRGNEKVGTAIKHDDHDDIVDNTSTQRTVNHTHELIKIWLTSTVSLGQYFELFIENGYDSLEFISKITDKSELMDIGITMPGHQTQIMSEIKSLTGIKQIHDMIVKDDSNGKKGVIAMQPRICLQIENVEEGCNNANVTRDAMKNDKIALGMVSTRRNSDSISAKHDDGQNISTTEQ